MSVRIMVGDARDMLATLDAGSVQCTVTSPPYHQLRDYGVAGQIGAEDTTEEYIANIVSVFREVKRVLVDDGTCWIVLGDCFGKGKQLQLMPYRVAMALQRDGWILRSSIVWAKPNPMPESVRDRPTNAHESVFLLSKRPRYAYYADAVREPNSPTGKPRGNRRNVALVDASRQDAVTGGINAPGRNQLAAYGQGRNLRNVWQITPKPFKGAHFATFPPELARRCILAGSKPGDTILDPFFGAGTTALACPDRDCIGIDISADYAELARQRLEAAGLDVTIDLPAMLEAAD